MHFPSSSDGITENVKMKTRNAVIPIAQKYHGHHTSSPSSDENTAPDTTPRGPEPPKNDIARFLFVPIGKFRPNKASPFGIKRAGPIPCRARQPVKALDPPSTLTPHMTEAM